MKSSVKFKIECVRVLSTNESHNLVSGYLLDAVLSDEGNPKTGLL